MKLSAPAAERNLEFILDVFGPRLPAAGRVLEVASGSGRHVAAFAAAHPHLEWWPSDPAPDARASIEAYRAEHAGDNLAAPLDLDVTHPWPIDAADAILNVNMIHISPWTATEGLVAGAARVLPPGGPLLIYGPFKRDGVHTAPSNAAFDESLRGRDPAWGVRDLRDVAAEAARSGLELVETIEMPANNLSVIFRRR